MAVSETTPLLKAGQDISVSDNDSHDVNNDTGSVPAKAKIFWVLGAMWSAVFLSALDGTIVATLVSPIGSYFEASHQASYLGTAYLLSVCCFTPLYGRLAEILGRKGAMLVALSLFSLGTLLCGIANSMLALIVARAVAGMGGGGILTVSSVAMSDLVPLNERGLYQGLQAMLYGLGSGLGGPLGGFINDWLGWRWAFLIQMPLLVLSVLLVTLNANIPYTEKPATVAQKLARIDWLGSLTLVSFVGCFLVAVTLKTAEEMPWSAPEVWGLLLISGVSGVVFVLVEAFVSAEPILLLRLLKRRTPLSTSIATGAITISAFSTMYSVPLYFSAVKLRSASEAGAHLLPNSVFIVLGALVSGWLIRVTGKHWFLSIACAGAVVCANLLMASWNENTSAFDLWFDIVPSGGGTSSLYGTTIIALISSVSHADMPVATGMYFLFRTTGQVLGVSMSGALVQSVLLSQLRTRIHAPNAEELIREIRHSTYIIPTLEPELRAAAVTSWAIALRTVFIFNAAFAFLALLACLPIEEHELQSTAKTPVKSSTTPSGVENRDVV
ncbi:vacuolar amino acid permease [Clavulina sp. PMI_390]|nr:vacuolar amino acid permease [Clavulina sp. PMI_390]